jgi:hypothetical protein
VEHGVNGAGNINVFTDIMFNEFKTVMADQVRNIIHIAGYQIIHAYHMMTLANITVAQVRT